MIDLLARVAERFGATGGEVRGDVLVWPAAGVAVAGSTASAKAYTSAGWKVASVGASFTAAIEAVVVAVKSQGVQVDGGTAVRDAAMILVAEHGVTVRPVVDRSGRQICWQDQKVMLVLPGGNVTAARKAGFTAFHLGGGLVESFTQLRATALCLLAGSSAGDATNPSSHEQRIMKSLLASGLPAAQRDVRLVRPDGSTYSQPDFAWPEVRLLLDLDGWYFHAAKALDMILGACSADDARKAMVLADRTRFEIDAIKRRRATVEGWTVMTCTDIEIDRDGPQAIARDVVAVYRRLAASNHALIG